MTRAKNEKHCTREFPGSVPSMPNPSGAFTMTIRSFKTHNSRNAGTWMEKEHDYSP